MLQVPRFPKDPWEKDKLNNSKLDYDQDQKSLQTEVRNSSLRYNKAFKSKVPRFAKKPVGVDPMIAAANAERDDYDTNTGIKTALVKSVIESSIKYANVNTVSPRFQPELPKAYSLGPTLLGPGSYNPARSTKIVRPRSPRTLILNSDAGKRFHIRPDTTKDLGTAVYPQRSTTQWEDKGFYSARSAKTGFVPPFMVDVQPRQMWNLDQIFGGIIANLAWVVIGCLFCVSNQLLQYALQLHLRANFITINAHIFR